MSAELADLQRPNTFPWEQLRGEPDEPYRRFLVYRNLGANRSLRRAQRRYEQEKNPNTTSNETQLPVRPNGHWGAESSAWHWPARAIAWDIRNLVAYGGRMASLHVQALTVVAEKNARWAKKLTPRDQGWLALLASIKLVGEHLTPDVIRGLQERIAREGGEALPLVGNNDPPAIVGEPVDQLR